MGDTAGVALPPAEHSATIDGVAMRYVAVGQGPPVVLLHGVAACHHFWRHNLGPLSRHFAVYAPDLPGHGNSAPPPQYDLPYAASFVTNFQDYLGVPQASLVGSSLGGLIALEVARLFPERVKRLVLVDSAGLGREVSWGLRWLTLPGLGKLLAHPTQRTLRLSMSQLCHGPAPVSPEQLWGDGHAAWQPQVLLRIARQGVRLRGIKPEVRRDSCLAHIRQPTLILWGEQDRIFPVAHAQRAHSLLPGSRLHIIPDCGHLPQWERPEAFNRVVVDFLRVQDG